MDVSLPTLLVCSAHLLVLVSGAALAESLGRVSNPRLLLAYWRGVAVVSLMLPCLALLVGPDASPLDMTGLVAVAAGHAGAGLIPSGVPTARIVWTVMAAGAVCRLAWLAAGAVRLGRLRRTSRTVPLPRDVESLAERVAPHADLRVSPELGSPAGYGVRRPVILLPERFLALGPDAQHAVLCHELLHVARRDWPWIVLEETLRAVLWFHPAAWWLIERIQETREQVIDRLVLSHAPSKRAYMSALLTFADAGRQPLPATAFLKKRHLRSRLQQLGKESTMSRTRLIWTSVALTVVVAGTAAGTVFALPLGTPSAAALAHAGQVVDGKAPGVTPPRVLSETKPEYTPEALQARIEGAVFLRTVVGTDGIPRDIAVAQSLDNEHGLDKAAIAALGKWRFEPGRKDGAPVAVRVTIEMRFALK